MPINLLRQHLAPSSRSLCYAASSFSNLHVGPCFLLICKLNSKTKANQSPSSPQIPGSPHVSYTMAKQRQNNTLETPILQMEYWETPSFLWPTHYCFLLEGAVKTLHLAFGGCLLDFDSVFFFFEGILLSRIVYHIWFHWTKESSLSIIFCGSNRGRNFGGEYDILRAI